MRDREAAVRTSAGRPAACTRTRRPASAAASTASTPGVRSRMQLQRTRDTRPELAVRRLLHASGLRYRVDLAPLPGLRRRADLVFGPTRVAVYVDGCFWHGCPQHGNAPRANSAYWAPKLAGNRARDVDTDLRLAAAGWLVLRFWEHCDAAAAAEAVIRAVENRRQRGSALGKIAGAAA